MSPYHLSGVATHTVELDQLHDISACLAEGGRASVTAEMLGIAGRQAVSLRPRQVDLFGTASPTGRILRPAATLDHVYAEGCVQFPYIQGSFVDDWSGGRSQLVVDLHTEALRRLSRLLGLRHAWGSGFITP
jgi:hypothetical protein